MVLKILLIISIVLQTVATVAAIRLVRLTKYNSVWIMFIIALTGMSLTRYGQYIQIFVSERQLRVPPDFFIWLGVVVSICISVGVLYARKLFVYIARLNRQRQLTNKRILTAVLRAEERARSRFSKELHDGLGPLLSSAKMSLSALDAPSMPEGQRDLLGRTNEVIEEAIRSLREISNNLSPQVLNDFGLVRGLQHFIRHSMALDAYEVHFDTNLRRERFDSDVEVILYRVVCELLNNTLKHARAHRIDLRLDYREGALRIDYADDGRGFHPEAVLDCGMGLSNIYSRIGSLQGTVSVESAPGEGMTAHIAIDLNGAPKRSDDERERL